VSAPEGEPPEDADGVAAVRSLRRAAVIAAAYGALAGVAYGVTTTWHRGLALTLAAAVSIVALRSLEGVVRRLRATPEEAPPGLGWQYPLRLLLLVGLILLLLVGWHDLLAVVLGLSAVPLALLVEAGLQLPSRSHTK